ncbi:MAG: helix-turn-helix domain-containing protein [Oscillospiraceae bacterium]|nr:helix-turn-helix domain-containing protein [Oscillospiraceae bacterium]
MDRVKTGKLIKKLRTDRGLTQKHLAEKLYVSDKTVSKWECGGGCPDLSLLTALSEVFGTELEVLLSGNAERNEKEKGDMNKLRYYVCRDCGNIITSTGKAAVSCCGNKLTALEPRRAGDNEKLKVEDIGSEWYITSDHEMTKEHHISFVAYSSDSIAMIFKQYPEWGISIHLPKYRLGRLVWYCTECGLLYQDIRP